MPARTFPIILLLSMLTFMAGLVGCDQTAALVVKADKEWDEAVDARNGAQAVLYLSNAGLEREDKIVSLALTASKSEVKALPYLDRYEVLTARLVMKQDNLKTLTGRNFYIAQVNRGWMTSTSELKRAKVVVGSTKTSATIYYKVPKGAPPMRSQWFLEDGQWKCDITRLDGDPDAEALREAQQQGKSVDEMIISELEEVHGDKLPASIWDPVAPTKKK